MQGGKEIRSRIRSVENTCKLTRAMEMVAAFRTRQVAIAPELCGIVSGAAAV